MRDARRDLAQQRQLRGWQAAGGSRGAGDVAARSGKLSIGPAPTVPYPSDDRRQSGREERTDAVRRVRGCVWGWGRFQACISVRAEGSHVLLDCGATSLVAMKRLGVDPGSVDAVLISHLHGDHFGGIRSWCSTGSSRGEGPGGGRPPGVRERTLQAMEVLYRLLDDQTSVRGAVRGAGRAGGDGDRRRGGDGVSRCRTAAARRPTPCAWPARVAPSATRRHRVERGARRRRAGRGPVHLRGVLLGQADQEPPGLYDAAGESGAPRMPTPRAHPLGAGDVEPRREVEDEVAEDGLTIELDGTRNPPRASIV